jgi:hypothetical protein
MKIAKYLALMGSIDTFVLVGGMFARSSLKPGFANPPLGQILDFVLPICLFVGISVTTLTPVFIRSKRWLLITVALSLVGCIVSGSAYVYAMQRYGRPIVIPQRQIADFVIVGSERTKFANEYFPAQSDFEMLTSRGWGENDLFLYWTRTSVIRARTQILLSFVFTLCLINLLVACAAALGTWDASGTPAQ